MLEGQRLLGDGNKINKWIPDPNKFLGDVNPKLKFLSTEEIVQNLAGEYGKTPHLLIEKSPIVKILSGQALTFKALSLVSVTGAFCRIAYCGFFYNGSLKPVPEVPAAFLEANQSKVPSVAKINTEVSPIQYLEFDYDEEESGSGNPEESHSYLSLSEIDSDLVSDSTAAKLEQQQVQVPSEVQYSESITQSSSNDSSVSLNSPARGSKK